MLSWALGSLLGAQIQPAPMKIVPTETTQMQTLPEIEMHSSVGKHDSGLPGIDLNKRIKIDVINHNAQLLKEQHNQIMAVWNDIQLDRTLRKEVQEIIKRNQIASSNLHSYSSDIRQLLKDAEFEYFAINTAINEFMLSHVTKAVLLRTKLKEENKYGLGWVSLNRLSESDHILAQNGAS